MNALIKELAVKAKIQMCSEPRLQQFAELIIEEHLNLIRQRWYDLNNREVTGEETPRDIGFRVGQKAEDIWLIENVRKHFGVNDE